MRPGTRMHAGIALAVLLASPSTPTRVEAEQADPVVVIVTGTGTGAAHVKVFDAASRAELRSFLPYGAFAGGVRVALGDVNGDGASDIVTGAGPGAAPQVKVIDGARGVEMMSFLAYDAAFTGGVFVAAGDVNGDGNADVVTGAGAGAAQVKVFDGKTGAELSSLLAYEAEFPVGVRVAAGDVNGDGRADLVTGPGPAAGLTLRPIVKVFDGATGALLTSVTAYANGFRGGVYVAAGDLNGDGSAEVVTGAGPGAFPQVKVFSGAPLGQLRSFMAYDAGFGGGVQVAAGDVDANGHADIVTGMGAGTGPGVSPQVKVFNGETSAEMASFLAYASDFMGGVFVAAGAAGEADSPPTIEGVITMSEAALADGRLTGAGPGRSAEGRAGAWMNFLTEAQTLIEAGSEAAACDPLRQAHRRVDSASPPPDFVAGSASVAIAAGLVALMEELTC